MRPIQAGPVTRTATGQHLVLGLANTVSHRSLRPEHGKSIDFGLVPSDPAGQGACPPASTSGNIFAGDLLTPIAASTVVNACFANNSSPYCSLISRYDTTTKQPGQVNVIDTPVVNLGNLSTSGIDFTLNYKIPHFDLGSFDPGNFKAGLATTYLADLQRTTPLWPTGCLNDRSTPAPTPSSSATSRAGAQRPRSTGSWATGVPSGRRATSTI